MGVMVELGRVLSNDCTAGNGERYPTGTGGD